VICITAEFAKESIMTAKTIRWIAILLAVCCTIAVGSRSARSNTRAQGHKTFLAGAAQVDITPQQLPVIVSGYFLERKVDAVRDPLYARALVLDDGTCRVAICVVDSLFMPRDLLDEAKRLALAQTGIAVERMLIAATHTHTAPSVVAALGSGVDEQYRKFLLPKIAETIRLADDNLKSAKIGWTAVDAPDHTHCRRWILRPDRVRNDVFGQPTVRANMHPGYQNPDFIGPAGPADTQLSILSIRTVQGQPLAALANYSMHYFGSSQVSADYFGRFVEKFTQMIGAADPDIEFVAAMSQGTSGDLHWNDYSKQRKSISIDKYSEGLARIAADAYKTISYHDWTSLGMLERKLMLRRRTPDKARLSWAENIITQMQQRKPKNNAEVYALEQMHLHEDQVRELRLQVVRIGSLGITAIPCEVFGITGLKIKAQSPLRHTFNIELAGGAEGYIPPPEQHLLGGYTTWPARSAALEVEAEPKIVETILSMLQEVSGEKRRELRPVLGAYDKAVLQSEPLAYWCMDEFQGQYAKDASGNDNSAVYEDGIAFYLRGPAGPGMSTPKGACRCVHFAGGIMKATLPRLGSRYSVEMWAWNGLPADARQFTGVLFSRDTDGKAKTGADHLGIGGVFGNSIAKGKLAFFVGSLEEKLLVGTSDVLLRTWNHIALVRDSERISVYLNGNETPEIDAELPKGRETDTRDFCVGGCNNRSFNFEGKIAKVAVYDRLLTRSEIARHYLAASRP
jgi:hypothetical protein